MSEQSGYTELYRECKSQDMGDDQVEVKLHEWWAAGIGYQYVIESTVLIDEKEEVHSLRALQPRTLKAEAVREAIKTFDANLEAHPTIS